MYSIFKEKKLKKKDIKELVRIFTNSYMAYWSSQAIEFEQYYVDNLKVWFIIQEQNDRNNEYGVLDKIMNPLWSNMFRNLCGVRNILSRQNNFLIKVCKENNMDFDKLFNKYFLIRYKDNELSYTRLKDNHSDIILTNKGA